MKKYIFAIVGKSGGKCLRSWQTLITAMLILAGITGFIPVARAAISEPDVVYFGTVAGGSAGGFIKLKSAPDGITLASAAVSGDFGYVIRIPMDLFEPRTAGSARSGDEVSFYLGEKLIRSVVIPDRGSVIRMELSATTYTLEDWKKLHPGDDGSGDINRNGISDLQDFLNSNDPAACIWTNVDDSHRETRVFNARVLQNCLTEAQSDGMHNLIMVAKGVYYGNFTYLANETEEFDLRTIGGYNPAGTAFSGGRLTTEPSETVLVGDRDNNENKDGRVFDISAGTGHTPSTVRLEGFRIMYGGIDWNSDIDSLSSDGLYGGGVRFLTAMGDLELVGNMFSDNFAFYGGAVYAASSGSGSILLANNVIGNNAAFYTGAVMVSNSGSGIVTLLNNTIVDNWAENSGDGDSVLIGSAAGPVDLSNNIIRGVYIGTSDIAILKIGAGVFPLTFQNNNIVDTSLVYSNLPGFTPDSSNMTEEPRFVRLQNNAFYYFLTDGDYRLLESSPGIDKGVNHSLAQANDPDGRARLIGVAVDMGAYERPLADDSSYIEPITLKDPVTHTALVAEGFDKRSLVTNTADYTINGYVRSTVAITGLSVKLSSGEWDKLPLSPDNTFTFSLTLENDDNWLQFEVAKADNSKVTVWYVVKLDTAMPIVELDSRAPASTNASTIPVTVTFSKDVTGFDASDVAVSNGAITPASFTGSKSGYAFTVTPAANGDVLIDIPDGIARDAAGNSSSAAARLTRTYDTIAPQVILGSPLPVSTYVTPIPVTVSFSEPVTQLDPASLIVSNGTMKSFTATDTGYSFVVTPSGQNVAVTVDVAAGAVRDAAGNTSPAAMQLVRLYAPPIIIQPLLPVTTVSPAGGYFTSTVVITIAASDNATIHYTLDGTEPGKGSPVYTAPITVTGTTTLRYFAVDVAGNSEALRTLSFVIDNKPPLLQLSTLADGSVTNNAILNVAGRVTDNSVIRELRINNTSVLIGNDGAFSTALTLNDGLNTIRTRVYDMSGNESSDSRVITLDRVVPNLQVDSPADNSKRSAVLTEISGASDEYAVVTVKANGVLLEGVTRNGASFNISTVLSDGMNTMEITSTDRAGNSATVKRSVICDSIRPSLAITQPGQDIQTREGSVLIKGTAADGQTSASVTVDSVPVTIGTDGSFERLIELGEQKNYAIVVKVVDEAGNETVVQRNIIHDTTAPSIMINPVLSPTNDRNQTIAGTREQGATITVFCPDVTIGIVTYPAQDTWRVDLSGLAIGRNTISVTENDAAGNSAVQTAEIMVGNIYGGPKTITLSAPFGMVIYYTTDSSTPTTASARYTVPIALSETTTFTYFAIDSIGNRSGIFTALYTIDMTPPALSITALPDGSSTDVSAFAISGRVTDNTRVESITINGAPVTFGSNGDFYTFLRLVIGINRIVIVATDIVGNTRSESRTITVLKDSSMPQLADALRALQISVGIIEKSRQDDILDVAPLANGKPAPDGKIDIGDAAMLLRRAIGLDNW